MQMDTDMAHTSLASLLASVLVWQNMPTSSPSKAWLSSHYLLWFLGLNPGNILVLSDQGSGAWSDVIAGINWSYNNAQTTGRPSVMNLSIQGGPVDLVDLVLTNAVLGGMHVAVAAVSLFRMFQLQLLRFFFFFFFI